MMYKRHSAFVYFYVNRRKIGFASDCAKRIDKDGLNEQKDLFAIVEIDKLPGNVSERLQALAIDVIKLMIPQRMPQKYQRSSVNICRQLFLTFSTNLCLMIHQRK